MTGDARESRPDVAAAVEALLAEAEAGGPDAGHAARRAAQLAEGRDPNRALRALAIAVRLDPLDAAARLAISRIRAESGDLDAARQEAAAVFASAIDQASRARAAFILGELARARDDFDEARDAYVAAAAIEEALLRASPADPVATRWYARAIGRLSELDYARNPGAARTQAEGASAILRALRAQIGEPPMLAADIADAALRLGVYALDARDPLAARTHFAEAVGRYEALAVAEPAEPHWRAALAETHTRDAEAALALANAEDARAAIDKAARLRVKLAVADPAEAWALASTWRVRAGLMTALGDLAAAADSLSQARAIVEQECAAAPGAPGPARFLAHLLCEQADVALQAGAVAFARDSAVEARRRAEPFAQAGDATWVLDLAAAWDRIGRAAIAGAALAQAQDAVGRAVALRRKTLESAPDDPLVKHGLAAALIRQGDAAMAVQGWPFARAAYAEAFQMRLELAEAAPDAKAAHALAVALERLGLCAAAEGDSDGARAAWEEEMTLAARMFGEDDEIGRDRFCAVVEGHLSSLGGPDASHHRAAALARLDRLAEAGALTESDIKLRTRLWRA